MRTQSVLILPALAALACHVPTESESGIPDALTERSAGVRLAHGEILYGMHCAVCHGAGGRADGPASEFLFPPARDFSVERFRLVSSANGAPFDRDLVATLRRGMPGSAMPAWNWLPEEDLWALASYVRSLAVEGLAQALEERARSNGDETLLADAASIARERLTPGDPLRPRGALVAAPLDLEHGRVLYLEKCASCHGPDGKGEPEPRFDEDGTLDWARDFTAGFLKGGDGPAELACRIRAGMPGTAMPPTVLEPPEEARLIAYVRSLIPEGTGARLVHTRASLRARRIQTAPEEPDDPAWEGADEIEVVLAPLWWSEKAVLGASLAALHDGDELALRLRWPDATGVVRLFSEASPTDGAALQLSAATHPALFGMGAPGEPTNLWHWQALRLEDVAGALDLLDLVPHALRPTRPGEVQADVPLYQRLLARPEPSSRVDRITVQGVENIAHASRAPFEVSACARWQDDARSDEGGWAVVFKRSLTSAGPDEIALLPGSTLQVACAVWNGAAGDGGARKSISIWQELVLEP